MGQGFDSPWGCQTYWRRAHYILRHIYFFLLGLFFSQPSPASPGEKITLAVLDLEAHKGMDEGYAGAISDRVRYALSKTEKYTLTSRRAMEAILKEQDFQKSGRCDNLACIVEVGKILGVRKMVAGRITKIGDLYQISIQLIDVESAVIENEVLDSCLCDEEELLRMAEEEAYLLAGMELKEKYKDGVLKTAPKEIRNSIGMELVLVPAGSFSMGFENAAFKIFLKKAFYFFYLEIVFDFGYSKI